MSSSSTLTEALIAVSILIAAAHTVRPIFPGREALIAAGFGLVHGMAFSATLAELGLSGGQLAVSLLGFNLGIELMQLVVVALVLPPLCVLARTSAYHHPLRMVAAGLTAVAAAGWLAARVGFPNPVATVADGLAGASPWVLVTVWTTGALALIHVRTRTPRPGLSANESDRSTPTAAESGAAASTPSSVLTG